ncbi:bifunctional UDP-N-acetylglucosamine diphosphorylase/glucosamine-1-phosphate N-acetyltransferase GlmU [Alphaproteobacteria bacterium]|nr:bifunctional UDP-N-acetylglucosamine diphosphorylase/glucosamine-1-phosphate N-acetyltransferase GlmU [Alphaproteobacteria bacterium]
MNICTVILGAGKSSRMKSITPKPFHKVANLELIDWVLNTLNSIKIDKKIIVSSKYINYSKYSKSNRIIIQNNQLGTGNAVIETKQELKNFKGVIVICFADTPFITKKTIENLISSVKNGNDIALTSFKKNEMNSYGKIILFRNKPFKITEDKNAKLNTHLCNGGIMAFNSSIMFNLLSKIKPDNISKEYYLTKVVEIAYKNNLKIDLIHIDEQEILGVNSKKDLALAEKIIQTKLRNFFLNKGVTLIDPETNYFSYDTIIEKDVKIYPNVFIGEGVKIESGSNILPFCHLENCHIKKNVSVGPFARIRGNTVLNNNAKIGNFVELKNVISQKEVKINHLSYLGDTSIGKFTNIGAGSITCNYDGYKKNKTSIGSNVFVGSNSTMIAPLDIGNNSTIGGGSVITENVKNGDLAIGRERQINKKGRSIIKKKN